METHFTLTERAIFTAL